MYYGQESDPDYIMHFGVKGMKWGVRRSAKSANIEGVGAGGGDVNEDEEERKRKQKELQEIAAAINEKRRKNG